MSSQVLIFTLELSSGHKGKSKAELLQFFFSDGCTP